MVNADAASWEVFRAFVEKRCPIASASPTDGKPPERKALSPMKRNRKASASESEGERNVGQPREVTPKDHETQGVVGGSTGAGGNPVKRSRTM